MITVHVKLYLNKNGREYFNIEWFPYVESIVKQQAGFISLEAALDNPDETCINVIVKFNNESNLKSWANSDLHQKVINDLDKYRTSGQCWFVDKSNSTLPPPKNLDLWQHKNLYHEIIAENLKNKMLLDLKFKEKLSFIQIATVAQNNNQITPKLRTVLFRYESELDCFQFDTSTHTRKWQQLSALPKLSAVYLNTDNFTQYRCEAKVELIDINNHKHNKLFTAHWLRTRPDLRNTLWEEYLKTQTIEADFNIEQPCPLFGTVLVRPYYWDIFTLDRQDFSQSKRCQMILENNQWTIFENTSSIHPLELLEN